MAPVRAFMSPFRMLKKFLLTILVLVGVLLAVLGGAYWFRDNVAMYGAERVLTGRQITLTSLRGLQFNTRSAAVGELELLLQSSGQRLVISGLDVDYSFPNGLTAPVVEAIRIDSARLLTEAEAESQEDEADSDALLMSDVLLLLREFPLASVVIDELHVPQREEAIALDLQHMPGELTLSANSGALRLLFGFKQADAAATAQVLILLTRNDATVGDFTLALEPADATFTLTGAGRLAFDDLNALLGELEQAPLALPIKAASLDWDISGAVADDMLGVSRPATFLLGLQAGSGITLPADAVSGLGELAVLFTDRMELSIATGAGAGISTGVLPVSVGGQWQQQAFNVNTRLGFDDCRLADDAACKVRFDGSADYGGYTLAGLLQLDIADLGAGLMGEYHLRTERLALGGMPAWLPPVDVDATISINDDIVSFNTPLLLANAPGDAGITTEGQYNLDTGALNLHASIPPVTFMEGSAQLSAWVSEWSYPFDLLTGSLAAEVDVDWQKDAALTLSLNGTLNDAGGFYNDIFFRGVSGDVQATLDTGAAFPIDTPPLKLTVAGIDVGLPIENVAVEFQLDRAAQQLRIASASGEVLNGRVSTTDAIYDFTRERNAILVKFAGLDMEQMLAQIDYEGVAATGKVSGELPITLTATGVEVAAGKLAADAPGGSIRYLAGAMAGESGNAGLDLINQALANYQFQSLTSTIEYKPDGELVLGMQLQGSNPDMQNGQRINLNLNFSDNIPALLESLQAARAIEDFLAEQYQ